MEGKKFYSIKAFVEELRTAGLHFSERTVRHWITIGKVRAVRPGGRHWYIPQEELTKLVEDSKLGNSVPVLLAA